MAANWLFQIIYASLLGQNVTLSQSTDTGNDVTTKTIYGELRGFRKLTSSNVQVDHYLGIPFALPPNGKGILNHYNLCYY